MALGMVRLLADIEPETLTTSAQEEVRRALDTWKPEMGASARRSPRHWRVFSGLAVAAAAIILLWAWRGRTYQIIDGDVVMGSVQKEGGQRTMALRSETGGRVQIADATVDLGPATEILWNARRRLADLRRGRVTVDVEHQIGQHLAIRTARFTVEVVGTRFTVDAATVRADRGVVQIIRSDGSVAARVEAGGSWSVDALSMHEPAARTGMAAPATSPTPAAATPVSPRIPPGAVDRARGTAETSPGSGLGSARRALARGDAQTARRIAESLFHHGRDVAVEARVIFAESFLAEGRYADAIDGYRLVVRDFPATDQAEISQFAIVQLEAEHGSLAQTRSALQAYVTRHPHGRFVKEATERLARLTAQAR
jgi:hypothetical protein